MSCEDAAGTVVLIARHGKVAWEKTYGLADIASGRPMRTDAMFQLYSMTKPITSVAPLTLYEHGRFRLTDPPEQYALQSPRCLLPIAPFNFSALTRAASVKVFGRPWSHVRSPRF